MPDQYYLTEDDIKHYDHMLSKGYVSEIVELDKQNFVVFEIMDKPEVGIAWPTILGGLDGLKDGSQVILEFHAPMHTLVAPHVKNKNIKILLFPRYPDAGRR